MIIVKLNGGLGNQMFQYAFGRARSLSSKTKLKLDLSWFENIDKRDTPRQYELDCFKFQVSIASKSDIKSLKRITRLFPRRIFGYLYKRLHFLRDSYFIEKYYHYDSSVTLCSDNTYFDGYWQSYKYFDRYRKTIKDDFIYTKKLTKETSILSKLIVSRNSISLHVRRGDYVTNSNANSFHGATSLEYYYDALNYLRSRVINPYIFIFSDDIEWIKKNLKSDIPMHFVENSGDKNPFEDIYLMSLCKHNIIANSSFSWWGAYLNNNPEKIVVAPKKWFADATINTDDLIPNDWIRL